MSKHVIGHLFADYVRMVRSRSDIDWSRSLQPEDLAYLEERIDKFSWYPMATFERLGVAILTEIAQGNLEAARAWGRSSVADLQHTDLIVAGDPRASIMRFQVFRRDFFDFEAIQFNTLVTGRVSLRVSYGMSDLAEEAACTQTIGFFEQLVEMSGGTDCRARFEGRSWKGDPTTTIVVEWS